MKRFISLILALVLITPVAFATEWTGQIAKKDGRLWLQSGTQTLKIANPEKAQAYKGQKVKVTDTADTATNSVNVESVALAF